MKPLAIKALVFTTCLTLASLNAAESEADNVPEDLPVSGFYIGGDISVQSITSKYEQTIYQTVGADIITNTTTTTERLPINIEVGYTGKSGYLYVNYKLLDLQSDTNSDSFKEYGFGAILTHRPVLKKTTFFLKAGIEMGEATGSDIKYNGLLVGIGAAKKVTDKMHLVVSLDYINRTWDFNNAYPVYTYQEDTGISLNVGMKYVFAK